MQWFRLWHDMPNDPKWRTIARVSQCSIAEVLAVYMHLLVEASCNAVKRGVTQRNNDEHIASALDLPTEKISAIKQAMQGRVMDGETLTGWDKRQPKREDNSAERVKKFRETKKQNELKRDVTHGNAPEAEERKPIKINKKDARPKPNGLYNDPTGCGLLDILVDGGTKLPVGWVQFAQITTKLPIDVLNQSEQRFIRHYVRGAGAHEKREGVIGWNECWSKGWLAKERRTR